MTNARNRPGPEHSPATGLRTKLRTRDRSRFSMRSWSECVADELRELAPPCGDELCKGVVVHVECSAEHGARGKREDTKREQVHDELLRTDSADVSLGSVGRELRVEFFHHGQKH